MSNPYTEPRFIVDSNAGKLARWLRVMGYDAVYFPNGSDSEMLDRAVAEGRVLLTRDTHIIKRGIASSGRVKVVLLRDDDPAKQLRHVITTLGLDCLHRAFSLCLECNTPLTERKPEEVKDLVPPHVYKTQTRYLQCPSCHRVYWGGSHKRAMEKELKSLACHGRE